MWTAEVVFPTPPFALVQVMIIALTHVMSALYCSNALLSIHEKLTFQNFELAKCRLDEFNYFPIVTAFPPALRFYLHGLP